jgi:hypothetical protein
MRTFRPVLAPGLAVLLSVAPAAAQQASVVDPATLRAAVRAQASQADADRAAIGTLLSRPGVRQIAARAGLEPELNRAIAAAAALDGGELAELAARARAIDETLAGGASTVTISTTTIIIALLLVILLIVALD